MASTALHYYTNLAKNIFLHYFSSLVIATQRTLLFVVFSKSSTASVVVLLSIHWKVSKLPLLPTIMEKLWWSDRTFRTRSTFHKYCLTNDRTWLYMIDVAVCGFSLMPCLAVLVEFSYLMGGGTFIYLCVQYLAQDMPSTLLRALFYFFFFRRRIGLVP